MVADQKWVQGDCSHRARGSCVRYPSKPSQISRRVSSFPVGRSLWCTEFMCINLQKHHNKYSGFCMFCTCNEANELFYAHFIGQSTNLFKQTQAKSVFHYWPSKLQIHQVAFAVQRTDDMRRIFVVFLKLSRHLFCHFEEWWLIIENIFVPLKLHDTWSINYMLIYLITVTS